MSTNYDHLTEIYQESKHNPIKRYSEEYTFLGKLGPIPIGSNKDYVILNERSDVKNLLESEL